MLSTLIEGAATAAARGVAAAVASVGQLTPPTGAFEAILRGSSPAEGAAASEIDAASGEELEKRIAALGEELRGELERHLAGAGIALDSPLSLQRNAIGQWTLSNPDGADRVAVEQSLADLPRDFAAKLAEYRRAVATRDELAGGGSSAFAALIDERDSVDVTVSRDGLVVE